MTAHSVFGVRQMLLARSTSEGMRHCARMRRPSHQKTTRCPYGTASTSALHVGGRVGIEFDLAAWRAEIVRLAVVLALPRRLLLIDSHLANGIRHHDVAPLEIGAPQP